MTRRSRKRMRNAKIVLLVDDDLNVRRLVSESLQISGYRVLEAYSGRDAIAISERHPERIDLLLSDIVMPGMTGVELADHLKTLRPDMRIMFMSGYDQGMLVLDKGWQFIRKPFLPSALTQKVGEVLQEQPDATISKNT
jgi:two-component system, cell cycle sensor histidine kinase and response regulator CckA